MNRQLLTRHSWAAQLAASAVAVVLSLAAGASYLLLDMPFAPLGVVALIPAAVLFFRPVGALYLALFVKFLPPGMIDFDLQSLGSNLILFFAVAAWFTRALGERRPIALPPAAALLGGVILLHFVSLIWAPDLALGRSEIVQWMIIFLMLIVILNVVDSPAVLNGVMRVLALNGWALVLSGLFVVLTGAYVPGERLQVFEMNENGYSIGLITSLAGVMWLAVRPGRGRLAVLLSLLYIPLAGLMIVFSGSRGGLLSLALVIAIFALVRSTRPWAWYIALLGVVAVAAVPGLFLTITNRLNNPEESLSGDRDILWKASADMIGEHPFGVGVGHGPYALYDYILRYTSSYAKRPNLPSHNPILEIGIDTGLPGMLLYSAALAAALWAFWQAYRRLWAAGDSSWNNYFFIVAAVLVGYVASWIKSGGVYYDEAFIRQFALLLLPACAPFFRPRSDASAEKYAQ